MAIKLFGTTVRETLDYFLGVTAGRKPKPKPKPEPKAAPEPAPVPPVAPAPSSDDRLKIWARLVISVLIVIGGSVMLLAGTPQAQQAGAGFIGLVIGYWLK